MRGGLGTGVGGLGQGRICVILIEHCTLDYQIDQKVTGMNSLHFQ